MNGEPAEDRCVVMAGTGRGDDRGVTLVEVMVAMSLMVVVMSAVTAGVVDMFRTASTTALTSTAQSQVSLVVLRLDRQVRYASGISLPRVVDGTQYVEYMFVEKGRNTCVQLRVTGGKLQQRSWTSGSPPQVDWTTLASGVATPQPFTHLAADDQVAHQRLTVAVQATADAGVATRTKHRTVTFTALNTTRNSPTDVCSEAW